MNNRPAREIKFLPAKEGTGEDLQITWADNGEQEVFPNVRYQFNQVQYMDGSWGRVATFMDKNVIGVIESMHYSPAAKMQNQIANFISTHGRILYPDMPDGVITHLSILSTDETMPMVEPAKDPNKLATLEDIAPIVRKPSAKPAPTDDEGGDGPVFA